MKIENIVYRKFYNLILESYIQNILLEEEWNSKGKEIPKRSPKIWEIRRLENGKEVHLVYKVNNQKSSDTRIYYRYLTDYKTDKAVDGYLEINNKVLIESIKFLGLSMASDLEDELDLRPEVVAGAYFQLFLEKFFPKYLKKNPVYKVVDFDKNIILIPKQEKGVLNRFLPSEPQGVDYLQSMEMNYDIIKLVNDFYKYIVHEDLRPKGWDLLSPSFKKKFVKGYQSFDLGYTNTEYIKDLHVWDIQTHGHLSSCKVFYLDSMKTHTSYDLLGVDKIKIEDLDVFIDIVNDLVVKSKDTDLKDFEKIEIQKLFDPSVSEYIWYKGNSKPDVISQILPDERQITVPRVLNVDCIKIDETWLIKGINPISSRLIR